MVRRRRRRRRRRYRSVLRVHGVHTHTQLICISVRGGSAPFARGRRPARDIDILTIPLQSGLIEKVSDDDRGRCLSRRRLRRHAVVSASSSSGGDSSPPGIVNARQRHHPQYHRGLHPHRRLPQSRPSPLVCRRRLMPRPVFPVVRLPYDQPDRVARVLDTVRREFRASRRQRSVTATDDAPLPPTMTAPRAHTREPETIAGGAKPSTAAVVDQVIVVDQTVVDQTVVDQVTVGVRDCTLTPKARPEIFATAGDAAAARNHHDNQNSTLSAATGNVHGPYLLVPPVNITAEISRPPLTPLQYTS